MDFNKNKVVGFIGGGNMAKAIAAGIVNKKVLPYENMIVSCRTEESLKYWKNNGAVTTLKNNEVVEKSDIIFFGVKPHMLADAIKDLPCVIFNNKLIISMLAGKQIETITTVLNCTEDNRDIKLKRDKLFKIIRIMPNTPLTVGTGCTLFTPSVTVTKDDIADLKSLLEPSGICEQIPEHLMNACGSVAASSPAFIYTIIEAMADGGVKMGIPRQLAIKLAAQATFGAANMVLETGKHTGVLKDEICSPGGTTITGIYAIEKGGVRAAMIEAMENATKRAEEIGK